MRSMKQPYVVLAVVALLLSLIAPGNTTNTYAQSEGPDPLMKTFVPGQFAGVVRDMTSTSDCHLIVSGTDIPCLAGSVVGSYIVPLSEVHKGEQYIVYSGNQKEDNAAMQRLMAKVGPQFASGATLPSAAMPQACGVTYNASGSFTASNFPGSPSPKVGYSLHYYLGYQNGVCNRVYITDSETHLISAGASATYLYATAFNANAGDLYQGWFPNCASLPHTSNYPAPYYLSGNSGYNFTDEVQSDCSFFIRYAYGYISLP